VSEKTKRDGEKGHSTLFLFFSFFPDDLLPSTLINGTRGNTMVPSGTAHKRKLEQSID
jgi:hypothetical protein